MAGGDDNFYARLAPFRDFGDFTDFAAYARVPDDWVVLAADIRGSTRAIADGRYKQVNMLGAAVITAVLNACRRVSVPYVFGGDGGAVVVPASHAAPAASALRSLIRHSEQAFGLGLRAAAVPVSRLRADGSDLAVRPLELNGANRLAMFAGGGIDRVDAIMKAEDGDPDVLRPAADDTAPDLDGLSCRWEPLVARHGTMIALMVLPVGDEPAAAVYRDVLVRLRATLEGGIAAHAPARDGTMKFRWPPRGLSLEARMLGIGGGRLKAWVNGLLTSLAQKWCHWRGVQIGSYHGVRYLDELKRQTDFRKYDGCLRMVLDCTQEQVAVIEEWLATAHRAGRLVYGLHQDTAALMTCLVFGLAEGAHVHFVDAAGGGFARAATGFKAQLKALGDRNT